MHCFFEQPGAERNAHISFKRKYLINAFFAVFVSRKKAQQKYISLFTICVQFFFDGAQKKRIESFCLYPLNETFHIKQHSLLAHLSVYYIKLLYFSRFPYRKLSDYREFFVFAVCAVPYALDDEQKRDQRYNDIQNCR